MPQCGYENPSDVTHCSSCGTNLRAYSRLLLMPDDLFNRGLSLAQGGHFQQAEQCLQAALLFRSRDIEALLLLAKVQALQGNDATASATLGRAVEKDIGDPHLEKMVATLQEILGGTRVSTPQTVRAESTDQPTKPSSKLAPTKRKQRKKRRKKRR